MGNAFLKFFIQGFEKYEEIIFILHIYFLFKKVKRSFDLTEHDLLDTNIVIFYPFKKRKK